MQNFIQKQLDASERLFNMMMADHKERMQEAVVWADMNTGLIKKLEERDKLIEELRAEISRLKNRG